jgi:hypothetical protein
LAEDLSKLTLTAPAVDAPPLAKRRTPDVPFTAIVLFCDDVRLEATGKLTLVGHYVSQSCQLSARATLDRCAIYLHATWPWRIEPKEVALRVDVPRREPTVYPVRIAERAKRPPGEAPPEVFLLQSYLHLRFPPLEDGDSLRVFLRVDGTERPAGHITVRRSAAPTAGAAEGSRH